MSGLRTARKVDKKKGYRVTVDTGGTFSDFVVLDQSTGQYRILKIPSTPDDPGRAILTGLDGLADEGMDPLDVTFFSHGTTVATNALLEERGARVGLAVTAGFRGIYETMEQSRPFGPAIFDLAYEKPRLLATESRTAEIVERVGPLGQVRAALDEQSVREALEPATASVESACLGHRGAYFSVVSERLIDVPVYARDRLRAGHRFQGPAIVEQYDATTVVCPEQLVTVDDYGNLLVETRTSV